MSGALTRAQAREGIRAWVSHSGQAVLRMTPAAILTGMTAAAFAPILVPVITAAGESAVVQALLAQFGGAGAGYLAAVIQRFADSRGGDGTEGQQALTEDRLRELLRESFEADLAGQRGGHARTAINALVLEVKGVDALVQAAAESDEARLLGHIVRALSEDQAFHADLLSMLDSLRRMFAELQLSGRDSYELQNRIFLEVLMLRRDLERRPAVDPGDRTELELTVKGSRSGDVCPYPGLAPFRERDAGWYFGRDALITTLLSALDERAHGSTPLVVAGVSGAGKSSVLQAGLIPALRTGGLAESGSAFWPVLLMRPDRRPLDQLALHLGHLTGALAPDVRDELEQDPARAAMIVRQGLLTHEERLRGGITPLGHVRDGFPGSADSGQRRLILVIDQFEEVFTRCRDDAERKQFIDAICAIAAGNRYDPPAGLVIIGLQIAFMEQCTAHPELRPALASPTIVGPMTAGELDAAIERPARQAGLTVEPGLAATMLRDLGAVESPGGQGSLSYDPGRLPLLAHALLATWRHRDGSRLTVAAYGAAGGVHNALAETADRLLKSLDGASRDRLRRLLVDHLVAVRESADDARRHVGREALLAEFPADERASVADLLDRLAEERLITADEGGIQIAHEALLRYWPALASWLANDRDWLRAVQRLSEQARTWADNGKDSDLLPRGRALTKIEEELGTDRLAEIGEQPSAFLSAARRAETRTRRLRRVGTVTVGGAVLAVVVAIAVVLQVNANDSRTQALSQSRQLVAEVAQLIQAATQRADDPLLALLLNVEAYRVDPGAAADDGLLSAQASFFTTTLGNPAGAGSAVAFNSKLLAVAGQRNAITVFQATTYRRAKTLPGTSPFYAVAFSPDGTMLAGAEQDGTTIVWSTQTWKRVAVLGTANGLSVNAVAFQPGGTFIATAGIGGTVTLWNLRGHAVATYQAGTVDSGVTISGIAFSPDGRRIAAACSDRAVRIWTVRGKPRLQVLTGHSGPVRAVAFSPDSGLLASSDDDGAIRLWNGRTGARLGFLPGGGTQPVAALAFSPHGTLLASGGRDDVIRLWDVTTRTQVGALTGPASRVTGVAFSRNGQTLASAEADPTVGIWNVTTPQQPDSSAIAAVATATAARMPIATIGNGAAIGLWNPLSAASYAAAATPVPLAVNAAARGDLPPSVALSPDGAVLAAPLGNQQLALWSTRDGHRTGTRTAPRGHLTSVAFSPEIDGPVIAAGGSDGVVYLWAPGATQSTQINGGLAASITSLAFSPDGKMLAAGSADGTFLLATRGPDGQWTAIPLPTVPLDEIDTVAFSPGGTVLATGSASGTVRLWDIRDPRSPVNEATLTGPAGPVISVAFSHAGMLAAASDDDSIRVWNARNPSAPSLLGTFAGLAGPASVAWEPGTDTLASAAPDGTLLDWDTDPGHVADRICNALAGHASEVAAIVHGAGYPPVCP